MEIKIDKKGTPCYSSVAVVQGRCKVLSLLGIVRGAFERGASRKYRPHLVGER